jgi:hypothetical protein
MKFSLVALATLVGTAVADLDPIVIKVILLFWGDIEVSTLRLPCTGLQVLLFQQQHPVVSHYHGHLWSQ